jgi:4-amino-4-deoxy-L-arabinose transferase-like glycosyltransferase
MTGTAPVPVTAPVPAWQRALYALALALPLLAGLGLAPLFDVDEGAFSEATREMLASGDWGHTTLNGEDRFDKPIGVYWLQAASVAVFGVHEFAFRLPSALSAWAMALALAAFAARRWGLAAGAAAGVLAVSSIGVHVIGRAATADGLLNLLLVLAGLDLWRFAETGARAPLRRAYAWVGLGLLVKGPVAALVPGAAFLVWALSSRRWDRIRQAALDAPGWGLMLLIAVPWYAYALHRHGMDFVQGFLLRHNLQRFSGPLEGHDGSMLYYFVLLPLLALPWAPLLARVLAQARRLWAEPAGRFLLGWAGFVLVFFSLSGTKLPHYVLYGYAPLVLLMARCLADAGRGWHIAVAVCVLIEGLILALAPLQVLRQASTIGDPLFRALLSGAPAPGWTGPLLGLGALTAVALVPVPAALRTLSAPRTLAAGLVMALFLGLWAAPWWGEALQGPVPRAAAAARQALASSQAQAQTQAHSASAASGQTAPQARTVVQAWMHLPSFAVYLGEATPRRDPAPGELAFTRVDRIPPSEQSRPRLFEERGLVVLGPRAP